MVPAYTGPIPDFTPSPEPEQSSQPTTSSSSTAAAGRKRKQPVARARTRSAATHTPMNQTSVFWQQTPANQTSTSEQPGSPAAGPSRKRARTQAPIPSVEGGAGEGNVPHGGMNNNNNVRGEANQPGLFDPIDLLGDDFNMPEEDPALRNASLQPTSPGDLLPKDNDNDDNNADEAPALLNYLDIHPNVPLQSIERHRSIAPGGGGVGGAFTSAPNSGFPTPQQQQQPGLAPPANLSSRPLWPAPYSHRGAVARDDPYGVWYFDPHDTCQIHLGHRHDFDGGVWFTSETSVWMSFMAMQHTEGIGFMLGVAAAASQVLNTEQGARYFGGGNLNRGAIDPRVLMQQAARVVREHVPPEVLDQERFGVPDPTDVALLATTNRRLPAGNFYDPFHRRVVGYDMTGRGVGIQNVGGGGGQQGDGAPGPSRQRDGQGDGRPGSTRPSRQGTVAPPQARGRQRTATPGNGGPARQGPGAPGPSN